MKAIYETERYAGKFNIDYRELEEYANSLLEESSAPMGIPVISYARVSTVLQLSGISLYVQHRENIKAIRDNFDNPIVFVSECGSGAAKALNRLLYEAICDAPEYSGLYANAVDRLTRNVRAFIPIAKAMDDKKMLLICKADGKHQIFSRGQGFEKCVEDIANGMLTYETR